MSLERVKLNKEELRGFFNKLDLLELEMFSSLLEYNYDYQKDDILLIGRSVYKEKYINAQDDMDAVHRHFNCNVSLLSKVLKRLNDKELDFIHDMADASFMCLTSVEKLDYREEIFDVSRLTDSIEYEIESRSKKKVGTDMKEVEVCAAVMVKDGKILATQRGYGDFKGKWEFPGGKIDKGETLEQCIVREIKEESNADINVLDFINTVEYDYPTFHLKMHSFLCELLSDMEVKYHDGDNLEHLEEKWLSMDELDSVDWLPADILVIEKLKQMKSKIENIKTVKKTKDLK